MIIKQYCVTHNNSKILNEWYLNSFFDALSDTEIKMVDHYIINNHSNFSIYNSDHLSKVKVLHNVLRPDWSTGHLSRNWNEGLVNGFGSLKDPLADIVILVQEDTIFQKNYINNVIELVNKGIDFLQIGAGDQFHCYTPTAIKRIGLWDERFSNIGHQEADYFMRSLLFHHEHVSLNDYGHKRVYNPTNLLFIENTLSGLNREDYSSIAHRDSSRFHNNSYEVWKYKYTLIDTNNWDIDYILNHKDSIKKDSHWFPLYPYFEKDVETLIEQGYKFGDLLNAKPIW